MAVGNNPFPVLPAIEGCRLSAVAAGIRYQGRDDLVLIEFCEGAIAAGCFTQNAYQAAPVIVARQYLSEAKTRYLVINSGNANACTGEQGELDARASCAELAALTGVSAEQVLPFSTGVIGEHLNMPALLAALPRAVADLDSENWKSAASGITTTDTFPKGVTRQIHLGETSITLNGIAKGSGMIRPDMATMLAYVVTDARIEQDLLDRLCRKSVNASFNRITVDGDTSTNDACILASTQRAKNEPISSLESEEGKLFSAGVEEVFIELAKLLVRDGEGATKFVTVTVVGGTDPQDCLDVAYTVSQSPLVKTALFASDPNWGRIVMAIGRSGVSALDASRVRVWLDETLIVEKGGVANSYTEEQGQAVLNNSEFSIKIDLGMGSFSESIWTCDFSHEYVSINADYRS